MSNQTISSRNSMSRSERQFILSYMPAAFAAGSLVGSILMMSIGLMRLMPEFLGFSLHGLGFALAIAAVAILFEQNSAEYRTQMIAVTDALRDARRRWLLTTAALGALAPNLINLLLRL